MGYLEKINQANVYDVAIQSPVHTAYDLSKKLKNTIYMKREDLQPVFSFKLRGAFNKIRQLSDDEKKKGIITSSAGNHAQGVALSAQKLDLDALIVMPTTTPQIKVDAVKKRGAKVKLVGDSYDEANEYALEVAEKEGRVFIHPYDDPDVIAGQGTIAKELHSQIPEKIDAIFVPVGGGGLIAGITAYFSEIRPEVKIIGVEPEDAANLKAALDKGKRAKLKEVGIFADGVAVKQLGKEPYKIIKNKVTEVITLTTDEICGGIKDIFDETRSIVEPAGALSMAAVKKYIAKNGSKNCTFVTINCGANVNFDRLRHISERAEIGEEKEALFAVTIPEEVGSFKTFCKRIGKRRHITEFNYRYENDKKAHIFVGIALKNGRNEREEILKKLAHDYTIHDLTDNELAKLHIRHMVGGHTNILENERIVRFQFPERPGALMNFLNNMGAEWNISLFHYRNHGAAYGRVLAGIQVPPKQRSEFKRFLKELTYKSVDETDNIGFKLFLK
jgi:threonine dehydratase